MQTPHREPYFKGIVGYKIIVQTLRRPRDTFTALESFSPLKMWEFYTGKVLLITGASGFLGTTLVYRLRQKAPVEHIFLICRKGAL